MPSLPLPLSSALTEMQRAEFINIDLELISTTDLSAIADELKGNIFVLFNGLDNDLFKLEFECNLTESNPDQLIRQFISLLNGLSANSKDLINNCSSRVFDLGYDSGNVGVLTSVISSDCLSEIAKHNFDLRLTIYPIDNGA